MGWDGKERRNMGSDHDLLTRIDEKMTALVDKLGIHIDAFNSHVKKDVDDMKIMADKQNKTDIKMAFYAGGLAVLLIVLKFVFKVG